MAKSAASPSFEFRFSDATYTTVGAEAMFATADAKQLRDLRAEYTRMRDVAQKRLGRLGKAFPKSKTYQQHAAGFKKLHDIPQKDLGKAFSELAKFLRAKGSTVSGQKEIKQKTINTFQEQGLPLNPKNYDRVIDILERARLEKLVYGSDEIIDLADATLDMSNEQFDSVLDNLSGILAHAEESIPALESLSPDEMADIDSLIEEFGW